jgi:hypothetical protein
MEKNTFRCPSMVRLWPEIPIIFDLRYKTTYPLSEYDSFIDSFIEIGCISDSILNKLRFQSSFSRRVWCLRYTNIE